ncbi:uncharacterized protein LOC124674376 [Lolium rigidum]|uniref:uncharacterized protein LOC124674376 n=1 Tax=Lolium rigidum TaxID=89674 RepID=UPI001F5CE26A|nr:uncharacterized protein LOC124674376 [Lolium rigidum]XP_047066374.1 uncharacterized protein LOC124674376 [Lolium rigidum]XP_047066375.1 uncharacterized protein LOC124674376 [Lolium rigidum]XP_051194966.1 uncharacterized protein LOC127308235 [Lolium perenne]
MSCNSLSDYIQEFCVISWWRPCMRTFRFGTIDTFSENRSKDWTKERSARTCYQRAHKGFGVEAGCAADGAAKTLYSSSISRKSPNGFVLACQDSLALACTTATSSTMEWARKASACPIATSSTMEWTWKKVYWLYTSNTEIIDVPYDRRR